MSSFYSAPWHRASFDKFISDTLPELLASRLPLTGYTYEQTDEYTHRVTVSLASNGGELEIAYDLLSPNEEGLFDALVPQYLKGIVYGALVSAFASEQAARMTAMDAATKNADEMLGRLGLRYNRARQASITSEITEIVAGAAALED